MMELVVVMMMRLAALTVSCLGALVADGRPTQTPCGAIDPNGRPTVANGRPNQTRQNVKLASLDAFCRGT